MYLRLDLIKKVLYNENMDTYFALAEPTRREIIELLARKGELPASDIYRKFKVSAPAISQHLKVLKEANLVKIKKQAQKRIYHINPKPMIEMENWIQKMTKQWNQKLDALEELIIIEQSHIITNSKQK